MKIAAIMPIKLNNERLPGKNVMLLGGKPLLQHELIALQNSNHLEDIYVFCSNEAVCEYLTDIRENGAETAMRKALVK